MVRVELHKGRELVNTAKLLEKAVKASVPYTKVEV